LNIKQLPEQFHKLEYICLDRVIVQETSRLEENHQDAIDLSFTGTLGEDILSFHLIIPPPPSYTTLRSLEYDFLNINNAALSILSIVFFIELEKIFNFF
jgi:hypothetical protein